MRAIRIFGFISMMGMVAIAVFALKVPAASANSETIVPCEHSELECESPLPNPTTIVANAENIKILTNIGTVQCLTGRQETTILVKLWWFNTVHVLKKELLDCHMGSTSCTVTTNNPGTITLTKTASLEALAQYEGETFTVKCGSFINCKYGGKVALTAHSSAEGVTRLLASEAKIEKGEGFLCPSAALLDAVFTFKGTMYIES